MVLIQRVATVVPRLVGIVENSLGALDFQKSCLFVNRIGNAWFSCFHVWMILYKSCVEVVFGMSVENFTSELLKTWSLHLGGVLIIFILQVVIFRNSALCVAISSFMLNILEVSCCWAIRWGVAFPRQKIDVAWTSFGRRSDVVFSYYISYPLSHTSLSDSLFILQYNKPLSKLIHQRLALPPMQLKTQHFL